ncbi:hypothetical protein [Stenotrophomonas maltophilia]|uniref:hypothetical protein n=1 Tax=Stenotrophomonas maltophilia TaxID=40324 RepID=UPI00240D2BF3|nr:hypothetical protein [Stenotrophomonas maltophilia]MDG2508624.1 hypothetical protein [Stenotrophomonas maltophilia]
MARQIIDIDTVQPNGKKGDPARLMSQKINGNFEELYGSVSGLAAVGGDNMLINCGVPINQRGFAGGALAAGAYGYDRWKAGTGGCNVTINATTGVFTHTSGPLQQIVEAPQLAWGQPLTISVENPSGSISVSVGGATGTITAGSGRRGITLTPSGSGNMTVQLTASGVTYARPKLERGSAASPFVARPQALEVALCQRYYQVEKVGDNGTSRLNLVNGFFQNSTTFYGLYQYPKMRAVPSVGITPASAWRILIGNSAVNVNTIVAAEISINRFTLIVTCPAVTAGSGGQVQTVDSPPAGAGLYLDAEL